MNSLRGDEKERLEGAAHVFPDWWTVDYLRSEWEAYPNATCERPASAEPLNPPCKAGRHWSTCAYEAYRKTIRADFNKLPSTSILKNGAKERAFGKYAWATWRALSEEEKFSWARDLVRDEDPVTALVRLRRCNRNRPQPFVERPSLAFHKQLKQQELAEVGASCLEQLASLEPHMQGKAVRGDQRKLKNLATQVGKDTSLTEKCFTRLL